MAWVRFTRDYNYTPSADRRMTTHYKTGCAYPVKRECAEAAIAAGAAASIATPARGEAPEAAPAQADGGVFNGADPAAFDHDGDGHPGGSLPKRRRAR